MLNTLKRDISIQCEPVFVPGVAVYDKSNLMVLHPTDSKLNNYSLVHWHIFVSPGLSDS